MESGPTGRRRCGRVRQTWHEDVFVIKVTRDRGLSEGVAGPKFVAKNPYRVGYRRRTRKHISPASGNLSLKHEEGWKSCSSHSNIQNFQSLYFQFIAFT